MKDKESIDEINNIEDLKKFKEKVEETKRNRKKIISLMILPELKDEYDLNAYNIRSENIDEAIRHRLILNQGSDLLIPYINDYLEESKVINYTSITRNTSIYPKEKAIEYLTIGISNESGELAGDVKKYMRSDYQKNELRKRCIDELGDIFWYWIRLCDELDINPIQVINENIIKISRRKENNQLQGDGKR